MRRPTSPVLETALPELAPYGILGSAVDVRGFNSDSWLDRFTYETPDARIAIAVGDMVDVRNTQTVTASPNGDKWREFQPYNVQVAVVASSFADDYDGLDKSVKSYIRAALQKAIEREFWNGVTASTLTDGEGNRWLNSGAAVVAQLPGALAPVKPKVGLALIEQALGASTIGARGTIHTPRAIASIIGLDNDEQTLYTNLLTPVVAGGGYQMDAGASTAWIFGTGPVTVRHGKPVVRGNEAESFDRKNNTFRVVYDIPVAVTWSTSELQAVRVDLSLENN